MRSKKKILIVEDEPDLITMFKARFESEGYRVDSACDGLDGIKKTKKIRPDLILLDIRMPKLDGYSMAKQLKEDDLTTGIPIIVVSAKETMKAFFKELGINHYFVKPVDIPDLLRDIKNMLKENN